MSPFLAILALQSATVDPAKDPTFDKAITIRLPFATVRETVGALAKASGQPLDVSATVADWKATMLVKGLPAGRTMEALADALGLVWKKDGAFFRLSRPDGAAAQESAYVKAERAQRASSAPAVGGDVVNTVTIRRSAPPRRGRGAAPPDVSVAPVYSRFEPSLLGVEAANSKPLTRLEPPFASGESEFAKVVNAWPQLPKEFGDAWNQPTGYINPKPSIWVDSALTLGDLLAAWHDATGLPVVADAFRISMKGATLPPGTALGALQGLVGGERLYLKVSEGVARLRHPAFWRLREQEVPEFTWNAIEKGALTVDNYASLAGRLTAPQVAAFRSQEPPLSKVKTAAIRDAYPALMLWSALAPQAKKLLLAGTPVGLESARSAVNAYAFALREAPYYQAGDPTRELATDAAKLGIFCRTTPKSVELRLADERGGGVSYLIGLP